MPDFYWGTNPANTQDLVENFESIIWTERYNEAGQFELVMPHDPNHQYWVPNYYLRSTESDYVMRATNLEIESRDGKVMSKFSGKDLSSILSQRIALTQTWSPRKPHNRISALISICFTNPSNPDRKILNFEHEAPYSWDLPKFDAIPAQDAEVRWRDCYTIIEEMAKEHDFGFRWYVDEDLVMKFQLYFGHDRSLDQTEFETVIFTPDFGNLENSRYVYSQDTNRNIAYIGGEGEGAARRWNSADLVYPNPQGLGRRELFVDAGDISSDEGAIPTTEYMNILRDKGRTELKLHNPESVFDGQVTNTQPFRYGWEYGMGDIVELQSEYGMQTKARVVEYTLSISGSDYSAYPTLKSMGV